MRPKDPFPEEKPELIIVLSQHAAAAYLDHYFKPSHEGISALAIGKITLPSSSSMAHWRFHSRVANSEGLLAMPQVQALYTSQRVWLLTGEGGRDLGPIRWQTAVICSASAYTAGKKA